MKFIANVIFVIALIPASIIAFCMIVWAASKALTQTYRELI